MTTKEYLGQISRLDRMINNKLSEILQYKELAIGLSAIHNDIKVKISSNVDKIGNSIARIEEMENQLDTMIDQYVDKKNHIISQIDAIEDEILYQILFARYIEKKTFEKIADELNYSQRQISRLHENALEEFEKRYGTEYLEKT